MEGDNSTPEGHPPYEDPPLLTPLLSEICISTSGWSWYLPTWDLLPTLLKYLQTAVSAGLKGLRMLSPSGLPDLVPHISAVCHLLLAP